MHCCRVLGINATCKNGHTERTCDKNQKHTTDFDCRSFGQDIKALPRVVCSSHRSVQTLFDTEVVILAHVISRIVHGILDSISTATATFGRKPCRLLTYFGSWSLDWSKYPSSCSWSLCIVNLSLDFSDLTFAHLYFEKVGARRDGIQSHNAGSCHCGYCGKRRY